MDKNNFYITPGRPEDLEADYIVKATALKGQVKAVGIRSTHLCQKALELHQLSPAVAVAFGRFMTGSLLLADNLKDPQYSQTTNIKSKGPIEGMTVVCNGQHQVKGYCYEPIVESSYHKPGKLNIGAVVGSGVLTVIKDTNLREPYVGSVALVSGEIAEDFTAYLAESEQTASIMMLGVLIDKEGIKVAGGVMIQLMPGATEETLSYLEARVHGGFPELTYLLNEHLNMEQIIDMFLGDKEIKFLAGDKVEYQCDCSRERMTKNLITLGVHELEELIASGEDIHLECHFCDEKYSFKTKEITGLLEDLRD